MTIGGVEVNSYVVGTDLANGTCGVVKLEGDVALLVPFVIPDYQSLGHQTSTIGGHACVIEGVHPVHEDGKPPLVGNVCKILVRGVLHETKSCGGGTVTLLVEVNDDSDGITQSGSGQGIPLWQLYSITPGNGSNGTLSPDPSDLLDPLGDYVDRWRDGSSGCDHGIIQVHIVELEFCIQAFEAAVEPAGSVSPRNKPLGSAERILPHAPVHRIPPSPISGSLPWHPSHQFISACFVRHATRQTQNKPLAIGQRLKLASNIKPLAIS